MRRSACNFFCYRHRRRHDFSQVEIGESLETNQRNQSFREIANIIAVDNGFGDE